MVDGNPVLFLQTYLDSAVPINTFYLVVALKDLFFRSLILEFLDRGICLGVLPRQLLDVLKGWGTVSTGSRDPATFLGSRSPHAIGASLAQEFPGVYEAALCQLRSPVLFHVSLLSQLPLRPRSVSPDA
jgi:hypothetical protein